MRYVWKKRWKIGLTVLLTAVFLAGCGAVAEEESAEETEAAQRQTLYAVTVDGNEIRVGETTVQTLLDEGFCITVSEMTDDMEVVEYEIDPELKLEANSYYTGGSVFVADGIYAHISMATGMEAVRMGDAVIARLEFSLIDASKDKLDALMLDGVPVAEISRERAGEMFPDFEGDGNVLLQYGQEYRYDLKFGAEDGMLSGFSVEKTYDVDWSGE